MELRHATQQDFPAIRTLWDLCFGDDAEYIDLYLEDLFLPRHSYLLEDDGLVRSMIFSIPATLHTPKGPRASVYLYAMATHPDSQGKGYGLTLMDYVARCCREAGIEVITLKPADMGLFRFYAKSGYETAFYCGTRTARAVDPPAGTVNTLSPEEYHALRESLLSSTCHVEFSADFLAHQAKVCALSGGALLALGWDGHTACAVTERIDGEWQVKELLAPTGCEEQALALLAHALGAKTLSARVPDETGDPFGVALWTHNKELCRGWLGPALD